MNDAIKGLINEWDRYAKDPEVLNDLTIPEGAPILSFAGFMTWLKKERALECICPEDPPGTFTVLSSCPVHYRMVR